MTHSPPTRSPGAAVFLTLLACLVVGVVIEALRNWTDWRLGFSPPIWEIAVGWIGFSAFAAIAATGFILGGVGFYSAHVRTNRPHSFGAKEDLIRVKRNAAVSMIGAGLLATFGGFILWIYGDLGPEFTAFVGLARLTMFLGLLTVIGAFMYAKKEHDD